MNTLITTLVVCAAFFAISASAANNCPGAANSAGVNCTDPSLCCGAGTMSPSCLPPDGSQKCCVWYLSARQCNPDQVCGGSYGYGASSYAQCGPPNTTFCNQGDGSNTFCSASQPTCCGNYGSYAFCCAPGCACNNSYYSCSCPSTQAPSTIAPTTAAPTTAPPPQNNCPAYGGNGGFNCSDPSLCCGAGTISPSCLPADGSKKCCTHYLSATQCNQTQVCGGSGGPGASSYAQCGPPGSTFCDKGDGQGAFCTAAQPTCCGYYGSYGFCCAPGCACNNSYYTCSCPASTAAPSTAAPTTSAPATTPAPPKNNCPAYGGSGGVNCSDPSLCCGYGSISPSCLPANGTKQCCVHYLSATQCNTDQVCGGSGGPGASSYAQCGPPNSTFCDKGTGQGAFCTAAQPTCCGYNSGFGFCCAPGCACNNSYYTCSCPAATSAPTTAAPTTAPPPQNNCPAYGGNGGFNCSDPSLCCGAGTISPSCLPADGSKKCCTHYLSATQCNQTQVCGGSGGPGASSYAQCGPAGSTFCDKGDGQGAFCTAAQPTCCGYYGGFGFCCAPGCACNNSYYTCSCPSTTTAPTTHKPTTHAPTTHKPTTHKPTVKPTIKPTSKPKTCPAKGKGGKSAVCAAGSKCCGAPGKNAFCCKQSQRCNNTKGTCV